MEDVDPERALDYGLFSRHQARAAGVGEREIARRLRNGTWARTDHGVYRNAAREDRAEDPFVRAALRAGRHATASHLAAAQILGWDLRKRPAPLQFTVPRSNGWVDVSGVQCFRRDLRPDEVCVVGVVRVTNPSRTAVDLAADAPLMDAVVAIDSGLRLQQLSQSDLDRAARDRRSLHRYGRVIQILRLVDPLSGSVPESVARVLFSTAGLAPPKTQYVVHDADGRFLARVDFAWPEIWLVVEIDGFEWHGGRDAFQADHDRQNDLEMAGWTVLRFTPEDVHDHPAKVTDKVRQVLDSRGR